MEDKKLPENFSGLFRDEEAVRKTLKSQQAIAAVFFSDGRVATYLNALSTEDRGSEGRLKFFCDVAARICGSSGISKDRVGVIYAENALAANG